MRYYTVSEAANKMGVSRQWMRKLVVNGKIKRASIEKKITGNPMLVDGDSLERFLEGWEHKFRKEGEND